MEVIYIDEVDTGLEPINTDYELNAQHQQPTRHSMNDTVSYHINFEALGLLKKKQRPVERKQRTTPIKVSAPIQNAVFATFEDYLSATK